MLLYIILITFATTKIAAYESKNITLTNDSPMHVTILSDIHINSSITVHLANISLFKNLELIFPLNTSLDAYELYDGENSKKWDASTEIQPYGRMRSKSGSFTVKNIGDLFQQNFIIFRWLEVQAKNCFPLLNNLYVVGAVVSYESLKKNETCEIILLTTPSNLPGFYIDLYSDTSMKINLQSPLNNKTIPFPAYVTEANFAIYSPILLTSTQSRIVLLANDLGNGTVREYNTPNSGGLITSPSYSALKAKNYEQPMYVINTNKYSSLKLNAVITATVITGNEIVVVWSDIEDKNYTFTAADVGRKIAIAAYEIRFYNYEIDPSTDMFLFEYAYFESLPLEVTDIPSTSTLSDTTESTIQDSTRYSKTTVLTTHTLSETTETVSSSSVRICLWKYIFNHVFYPAIFYLSIK